MKILPFVETMITQVCNLSCPGCTNYSDLTHSGYVTWDLGKRWLSPWLERVEIQDFGIMGGEPLINPEYDQWISGVRELMPRAQIRFTTNGRLLKKRPQVVEQLADIGNCVFKISLHQEDFEIREQIDSIFNRYEWQEVREYGMVRWKTDNDFRFQINKPETFIKTYQGPYHDMRPWQSDPARAFDRCCQQTCPLLYQGKIYKCSTAGLLKDTLARFDNPNYPEWKPYIDEGIGAECSDADLAAWLDNFGRPHSMCGQCPTSEDSDSVILHWNNVYDKQKQG